MRVIYTATKCADCPLNYDETWCHHPLAKAGDRDISLDGNEPPSNCPLRVGELLIVLRVKGEEVAGG